MNKNRNEAAEVVEKFYCFFNIIEPGVLYYTFYDEKILFYPDFFYSFHTGHPGSGIYQFPIRNCKTFVPPALLWNQMKKFINKIKKENYRFIY